MEMEKITTLFTSCGRFNLLRETIHSFLEHNTYPIEKYIIIDNSTVISAEENIKNIVKDLDNVEIIINKENIGQVASIDKAYANIDTEYIFHSEDDWLFFDTNFIEKSLDILKERSDILNINLRVRFDGERGSMHSIIGPFLTKNNTIYYEYQQNYLNEWHGFSWNPGLRRLSDYKLVGNYKQFNNEQGFNKKYKELGFRAACLERFYCKHIGGNSVTEKSNC